VLLRPRECVRLMQPSGSIGCSQCLLDVHFFRFRFSQEFLIASGKLDADGIRGGFGGEGLFTG